MSDSANGSKNWEATRERFVSFALHAPIRDVCEAVSISRRHIYRIIGGECQRPHPATRQVIEQFLRNRSHDNGSKHG